MLKAAKEGLFWLGLAATVVGVAVASVLWDGCRLFWSLLRSTRAWMLLGAAAVIIWYWRTDPNGGAETVVRLQMTAWLIVLAPVAYAVRKALMPGDSKGLLRDARAGSLPSAVVWLGMAILTGLLFLAFASAAHAAEPPACAQPHLPVLQQETEGHWPDAPGKSYLAGQVEQETCPSLRSPKCWNPRTELKTSREYGFGLGQLTKTARFDNFAAARGLDVSLREWQWEDRFDARRQLRTLVLMDRGNYRRLSFIENAQERLAMTFAAYNGGLGGVLSDRRVCAAVEGCNPALWFGHVERHSLKAKTAVKGYGKSFFEINREYVRNIMTIRRARYAAWFGEG